MVEEKEGLLMDKKLLAHLDGLSSAEITAKANKMGDLIDDLEELTEILDDNDVELIERTIREIKDLRLRLDGLESRLL